MEAVIRLRRMAIGATLVLIAGGAVASYWIDAAVSMGLMIGGLAGVAGFWQLARQMEKVASGTADSVQSVSLRGAFQRLVLYGVALSGAFFLDPESKYGLLAAVVGLFVIRMVLMVLAFTGLDMEQHEQ